MSQGAINVRDIENLIEGFKFMSVGMKITLQNNIRQEVEGFGEVLREEILRNALNVYSIASRFNSEELFKNGRITFRDDNELIFSTIAGSHVKQNELMLFKGCSISRGDGSSYILINNSEGSKNAKTKYQSFDFDKLVLDAITPPELSIVINIGHYPSLIENILQVIK